MTCPPGPAALGSNPAPAVTWLGSYFNSLSFSFLLCKLGMHTVSLHCLGF